MLSNKDHYDMQEKQTNKILCPSSRCKPGAQLLGLRLENGKMGILPQTLPIDQQFIENTRAGSIPEERFRFVNKCVENGCKQWTGKRCGIADTIIQHLDEIVEETVLPACEIRPRCRWFMQLGENACRICPYVITEITESEVNEFFETKRNKKP